jgi:hypothetical protein
MKVEEAAFIKGVEDSRVEILSRMRMLDAHHTMLVYGYIGQEAHTRKIDTFTPAGRAASILLVAEAIGAMVPEEHRPWLKPEALVGPPEEMACEMGTCPLNFDRENSACGGCQHNKLREG